jgi:hypothetical protein
MWVADATTAKVVDELDSVLRKNQDRRHQCSAKSARSDGRRYTIIASRYRWWRGLFAAGARTMGHGFTQVLQYLMRPTETTVSATFAELKPGGR